MRSAFPCSSAAVVLALCLQPLAAEDGAFALTAEEREVLELTNAARKKENLPPLTPDPVLFVAARQHSANMAKQGKLDHVLDGKNPFDRLKAVGYNYSLAGENVAYGDYTIAETFEMWMKSKAHRDNILHPDFEQVGLGRVENGEGVAYYTQVFGTPKKAKRK